MWPELWRKYVYEVFVLERGIVARHLTNRSAMTIAATWKYKGFKAEIRLEQALKGDRVNEQKNKLGIR